MDQLSNLGKKPPKKKGRLPFGLTLVELPLVFTFSALILAHVWYGMYLFTDDLSEEASGLKYVPFRSEYEDMKKGFNNIRKRFSAKKSAEAEKSS